MPPRFTGRFGSGAAGTGQGCGYSSFTRSYPVHVNYASVHIGGKACYADIISNYQ